jgi:gliding motility-associated-like protein
VQTYTAIDDIITYTIVVENTGNVTLTNIAVADPKTGLDVTIASLEPGASVTYTETYTITLADLNSGSVVNTATATYTYNDVDYTEEATETVDANQTPALTITKVSTEQTYDAVGDVITYTIVVENTGNVTLTNIAVADPKTGLDATIASLEPGASVTYTETYTITLADLNSGSVVNTATAAYSYGGVNYEHSASAVVSGINPPLAVDDRSTGNTLGTSVSINILTNDRLGDGSRALPGLVTVDLAPTVPGTQTTLVVAGEGTWTYNPGTGVLTFTPQSGYTGNPTPITYVLTEKSTGLSDTAVVTVTYSRTPPTAVNDSSTGNLPGSTVTIDVLANDRLGNGTQALPGLVTVDLNPYASGVQTQRIVPGEGTWTYDPATGLVTFTPEPGFKGDPTPITYVLRETSTGLLDAAVITVTYAKPPPDAVDDSSTGNTPGNAVAINILANDKLGNGSPALPGLVTVDLNPDVPGIQTQLVVPGEGTWTFDPATGLLTFTPESGFKGDPTPITYVLTEKSTGLSDTAVVTITYVTTPPLAVDDSSMDNIPGDPVTINILANDRLGNGSQALPGLVTVDLNPDVPGIQTQLVVPGEGIWSYDPATGLLTFTPEPGFKGDPTPVTYVLTEISTGLSDTAVVTVGYRIEPPVADDDMSMGNIAGLPITIGILDNDRLGDGSPALTGLVTIDMDPSMPGIQTELVVPGEGIWRYDPATGTVTFTPEEGFRSDPTPVQYLLTEISTGLSDPAMIIIGGGIQSDASLTVEKTAAYEHDVIDVGELITYTITVTNSGNVPLQNVVVSDPLTGLHEIIATLAPGASETYKATYTVSQADINSGAIVNVASAAGTDPFGDPVYGEDTETVPVIGNPAIRILKTAASESITAEAGDALSYTIAITNTGNVTLVNVLVEDPETGLKETLPVLAPGETVMLSTAYTVTQDDIDSGSFVNTASVRGTDPKGGTVQDSDTATVILIHVPLIEVEKEAMLFTAEASLGEVITYRISVTNTGNVTLRDVRVRDPLTGLDHLILILKPGETEVLYTEYKVGLADESAGLIVNKATGEGKDPKDGTVYGEDTATTPVGACEMVIPNGFSPNNDGIQDFWRITCIEKYPDARVEVYNRWGNLVYEQNNYGNIDVHGPTDAWWDGHSTHKWTLGSEKLPTGTYFYILDLKDGSKPRNGFIFLNR